MLYWKSKDAPGAMTVPGAGEEMVPGLWEAGAAQAVYVVVKRAATMESMNVCRKNMMGRSKVF